MAGKAMGLDESEEEVVSKSALRRQREREHRFQTILRAAEKLFAKEGYHKTSMENIADASEFSVGAVYFYFKNKEDLLVRILEQIGFSLRKMLGNEFEKAGPSLNGFREAGTTFFREFCLKNPEKVAIIFRESVGQSPLVEEKRKEIFDKLMFDVLGALDRTGRNLGLGFNTAHSKEVIAVSIMGIYERMAYQYLFWQDRAEDLEAVGLDAVNFILGGIDRLFKGGECS